ncbi:MAG TPA: DUF72 domain-containing protein, partial [Candidatus Omnitrophica bacterium]|nr:DUF72 domain-containing protein [Candidatus Omnitrophota bacterium]
MPLLRIGTSGYNYAHWADGVFYPPELSPRKWLEFYSHHFDTVELNVTFYRLPKKKTFLNWYERTTSGFYFVIKGNRFITHIKRLKDCEGPLELFFSAAEGLKDKLKVVLWQMPPSLKVDIKKLEDFAEMLTEIGPKNVRHSFEFRDKSWFNDGVYSVLERYNSALCIADSPRWPSAKILTADFVYVRFHGGRILYRSNYSNEELGNWAEE